MAVLYSAATAPIEALGMTCECAVCNRYFREADVTAVSDGADVGYACDDCVTAHDGPGKFEGNSSDDLAAALVLYAWSQDGAEDDFMSSDGWGYCGRFGRWLLFEDERGAVSVEDCGSVERAGNRFNELHGYGMGHCEDDYSISADYGYWRAYSGHKEIGKYDRRSRALAAVSLEARRSGYYGSCWEDYGHGIRSVRYW